MVVGLFIYRSSIHKPSLRASAIFTPLSTLRRIYMEGKQAKPTCQFVKEEEVARCKWLSLNKITYKDPKGRERVWETAKRTTTSDSGSDVKQYRPPMKGYTLELPAGLVDKTESPEVSAVRELKEETGYTATVKHSSPITCLDPGAENMTVQVITAEIDGDTDENKNPQPSPEESEFIEVVLVPMDDLITRLNDFSKSGVSVDSRLYSYAIGLEMNKGHNETQTSPCRNK